MPHPYHHACKNSKIDAKCSIKLREHRRNSDSYLDWLRGTVEVALPLNLMNQYVFKNGECKRFKVHKLHHA